MNETWPSSGETVSKSGRTGATGRPPAPCPLAAAVSDPFLAMFERVLLLVPLVVVDVLPEPEGAITSVPEVMAKVVKVLSLPSAVPALSDARIRK